MQLQRAPRTRSTNETLHEPALLEHVATSAPASVGSTSRIASDEFNAGSCAAADELRVATVEEAACSVTRVRLASSAVSTELPFNVQLTVGLGEPSA